MLRGAIPHCPSRSTCAADARGRCYDPAAPVRWRGWSHREGSHLTTEATAIPAAPPGSPFHALLAALSLESRIRLISGARVSDVSDGEAAVLGGQHVDALSVVLEGQFRVEGLDRHGLPVELTTFAPGDYFGEMSFLRGDRATATVRALGGARLLDVPHNVLAEIAAVDSGLTRELARVVATRLSATSERFRAMRPGRTVSCITTGTPWSRKAVFHVARSAALHARAPVLLVDSAQAPAIDGCEVLPTIEALAADVALFSLFEAFASQQAPAVGFANLGNGAVAERMQLISRLQALFPLLLVCETGAPSAAFDGPYAFVEADSADERARGITEVLLERANEPPRPARLALLSGARGTGVAAAFTGGEAALDGPPQFATAVEPWRSVDLVARILLRRTVGLALGAGGAKGYAHVGVARGLRALGVPIDYLAGCSVGAPIAAGLAVGIAPGAIKRELDTTFRRALRPTLPFQSFLSASRVVREMGRLAAGRTFNDVDIPLAIVAVDLDQREEVVLTSGPADRVLAASMAIPGIFAPVTVGGRRLVDGGLLNPVPTSVAAALGADIVIGVKLTDPPRTNRPPRVRRLRLGLPPIVDNIVSAVDIMQWKITADGAAEADITISPTFASPVGLRDFHRFKELIAAGEAATLEAAPAIKRLLPWTGATGS